MDIMLLIGALLELSLQSKRQCQNLKDIGVQGLFVSWLPFLVVSEEFIPVALNMELPEFIDVGGAWRV